MLFEYDWMQEHLVHFSYASTCRLITNRYVLRIGRVLYKRIWFSEICSLITLVVVVWYAGHCWNMSDISNEKTVKKYFYGNCFSTDSWKNSENNCHENFLYHSEYTINYRSHHTSKKLTHTPKVMWTELGLIDCRCQLCMHVTIFIIPLK